MPGIHVHLPDTGRGWSVLIFEVVLNPDIIGSTVLHPLEIVSQCGSAVWRQVVDRAREGAALARAEVIHTAYILFAIVRAIVPYDLIRFGTPLKSGSLLPVPGRAFPNFRPLVAVLEIDIANISTISRINKAVLKIDLHPQQVAPCGIELKTLVKE